MRKDVVEAEKEVEPEEEQDRGKAALTELFDEVEDRRDADHGRARRRRHRRDRPLRSASMAGRTRIAGEREVQKALRRTLLKYKLHHDQELFDRAYALHPAVLLTSYVPEGHDDDRIDPGRTGNPIDRTWEQMNSNDYTAQEALATLMRKLEERDTALAVHVQSVINAGRDIEEREPASQGARRLRTYRRTVPFSPEEALQTAVEVLRAYFIELPQIVNSTLDDFRAVAVARHADPSSPFGAGTGDDDVILEALGVDKDVQIEIETETQITPRGDRQHLTLARTPRDLIEDQRRNLTRLGALTTLDGSDG